MSCKEIAGISIAGNHEGLKPINKTRTGELHVQDIFDQVC